MENLGCGPEGDALGLHILLFWALPSFASCSGRAADAVIPIRWWLQLNHSSFHKHVRSVRSQCRWRRKGMQHTVAVPQCAAACLSSCGCGVSERSDPFPGRCADHLRRNHLNACSKLQHPKPHPPPQPPWHSTQNHPGTHFFKKQILNVNHVQTFFFAFLHYILIAFLLCQMF